MPSKHATYACHTGCHISRAHGQHMDKHMGKDGVHMAKEASRERGVDHGSLGKLGHMA